MPSPPERAPLLPQALEHVEATVWDNVYRAAAPDDVTACGLHCSTIGSATVLAASRVDVLFFNRVVGLGMAGPATDDELDAIVARYRALGVPRFFVQVSPSARPNDLAERLPAHGFRPYNRWMKLFRGVEPPPSVETTLRIAPFDPSQGARFAAITAPAFDWPDRVQPWIARLVGRPGWHLYAAYEADELIAVGGLYVQGVYGYMGPAVTRPAYRGRGAQHALLAHRIRVAADLGCTGLISETAEDRPDHPAPSFRNLCRFGFQPAYARPNYLYEG